MNDINETDMLSLTFDNDGLIPAIAQNYATKEILMMAWMNEEAFQKTVTTGEAHYWSRSRKELWHKGATSGSVQVIKEIRVDCDQDVVLLLVEPQKQGACHTGRTHCFYRRISNIETDKLIFDDV